MSQTEIVSFGEKYWRGNVPFLQHYIQGNISTGVITGMMLILIFSGGVI